jgi:ribosomal protein L30E
MATKKEETITIGFKEIQKGIKTGKVKKVVVARNCPKALTSKLGNVTIEVFEGDQNQLGTKLGKPFPVAMAGLKDMYAELK